MKRCDLGQGSSGGKGRVRIFGKIPMCFTVLVLFSYDFGAWVFFACL